MAVTLSKLLSALEATREFIEQRYVAALDDDDCELAAAYREVLSQLARTALLPDALVESHGARRASRGCNHAARHRAADGSIRCANCDSVLKLPN